MMYGGIAMLHREKQYRKLATWIYSTARRIACDCPHTMTLKYCNERLGPPVDPVEWVTKICSKWYIKSGDRQDIMEHIMENRVYLKGRGKRYTNPLKPIRDYLERNPPRLSRRR